MNLWRAIKWDWHLLWRDMSRGFRLWLTVAFAGPAAMGAVLLVLAPLTLVLPADAVELWIVLAGVPGLALGLWAVGFVDRKLAGPARRSVGRTGSPRDGRFGWWLNGIRRRQMKIDAARDG